MTEGNEVLFDRVGLNIIERFWWDEGTAGSLREVFRHFLQADQGRAWFRQSEGEWCPAFGEHQKSALAKFFETADGWAEHSDDNRACFDWLRREENGVCSLFMDADRFRSCVDPGADLPGSFFVGLEVDWCSNPGESDTVLTPHFRISNQWPSWDMWAPQPSPEAKEPALTPEEAESTLSSLFWMRIHRAYSLLKNNLGFLKAMLDITHESQTPPLFFYVFPRERQREAASYLEGDHLAALTTVGRRVLGSPDLRSMEITGGVMEGCLAVLTHSPSVDVEYCLVVPLEGLDEGAVEKQIQFSTYCWQDLDLDATWKVREIKNAAKANEKFFPLWMGSLNLSMELSETLFPLLSKEGIQVRMFDLTNLLSSFLAKLQARTFTEARTRSERRRELEWAINASKNSAQQRLTVRTLPGLQLSRNISDGYTRVFRGFEEEIARRAEEAHALATQIEAVSESLGQMAGMEERAWQKKNEAATNRLNRVLALVAVLAAIPLLVGQFDTDALSTVFAAILSRAFGWLPFRYDFQAFPYWTVGLWISFLGALVAVTLTLWTLATTSGKPRSDKDERRGFVSKARQCSEALFDSYREYKDADFGKMGLNGVDALDRRTAESVAIAMDHCAEWHREEVGEEIEIIRAERDPWWTRFLGARYRERRKRNRLDRAWAREAERQVCRFVVASDVFDLRPEKFHLPATLCLYRWKYASAALGSSPVSDWEFQLVMGGFDYTETEIRALEVWAISNQIEEKTASQAREAILAAGITAFNEVDLSEEIAALEAMEVEADIPDEGQETDSAPDQETPRSRQ